ncbi:unnamed protein product [Polarella glacialis]|uniref:Aminoglycoside phosphotransferase domain-containing protein n=1 Tax=Polarella glacialis TaxID=89957 RepID=A0A813EPH2_POLGL|nr:unnamed protein product [Polarella glacialis]
MAGEFNRVDITCEGGEELSLVMKSVSKEKLSTSIQLGLPREATFYNELAPRLGKVVPRAWYAHGDLLTGEKVILMENIASMVPAGVFFGPGNPNNWGLDLPQLSSEAGSPPAEQVAKQAFLCYAQLHAEFWQSEQLLQLSWLRGADWYQGRGQDSWQAAQQMAADSWSEIRAENSKAPADQAPEALQWDPHLVACLEVSFGKVSWQQFQSDIRAIHWTLVQGDCHPGNALWPGQESSSGEEMKLIDFEMVGIGSGAQELGQFLISHMTPALRRSCERSLVASYHQELTSRLRARGLEAEASAYSLEMCWSDYVAGGAGRWLWFVPYLAKVCPAKVAQYFNDQTAAFLTDHFPNPAQVGQPRV